MNQMKRLVVGRRANKSRRDRHQGKEEKLRFAHDGMLMQVDEQFAAKRTVTGMIHAFHDRNHSRTSAPTRRVAISPMKCRCSNDQRRHRLKTAALKSIGAGGKCLFE